MVYCSARECGKPGGGGKSVCLHVLFPYLSPSLCLVCLSVSPFSGRAHTHADNENTISSALSLQQFILQLQEPSPCHLQFHKQYGSFSQPWCAGRFGLPKGPCRHSILIRFNWLTWYVYPDRPTVLYCCCRLADAADTQPAVWRHVPPLLPTRYPGKECTRNASHDAVPTLSALSRHTVTIPRSSEEEKAGLHNVVCILSSSVVSC